MCTKFCFLCCVSIGGLVLLTVGATMLFAGYQIHNNPSFDDLENGTGTGLYIAGAVIFITGLVGAIFSWMLTRSCRWCFLIYAIIALVVGVVLIEGSEKFKVYISEESTKFSTACSEANIAAKNGTSVIYTDSARVNSLMSSWDNLDQALKNCRKVDPSILGLEECPDSITDDEGVAWTKINHWQLLKYAENKYTCGGFCRDAPSLFALPEDSVDLKNKDENRPACMNPVIYDITKTGHCLAQGLLIMGIIAAFSCLPALCLFGRIQPSKYAGFDDEESLLTDDGDMVE